MPCGTQGIEGSVLRAQPNHAAPGLQQGPLHGCDTLLCGCGPRRLIAACLSAPCGAVRPVARAVDRSADAQAGMFGLLRLMFSAQVHCERRQGGQAPAACAVTGAA